MLKKIILLSCITLVLIVAYNLLKQITDALGSQDRLSSQAEAVYKLEAKNKELRKKLSEVSTTQFIEEEARNKLGMGKPGETVVIIPDETLKLMTEATSEAKMSLPNWQGWLKVFFH